jgi:hypothetical protein
MSATLQAVESTSTGNMAVQEVVQHTVTVTVRQGANDAFGNPTYQAMSNNPVLTCNQAMLYRIRFELNSDALQPGEQAVFDDFAIVFADPDAPKLLITGQDATKCTLLWSNMDTQTKRSYRYTIRAHVGAYAVTHDPTVENIPPGTP